MFKNSDAPLWAKGVSYGLLALAIIMIISSIYLIAIYIKYSWIRRNNSLDVNGALVTKRILDENGFAGTKIKKSFLYLKYWNHNKKKNTYRLRHWTHNRKSIWTIMEATQQAYATTLRFNNKKAFWLAFRLPRFASVGGAIIGIALFFWGINPYLSQETVTWKDMNTTAHFKIWLGAAALLAGNAYAMIARQYYLKRDALKLIDKFGFTKKELKAVQKIWVVLFYYAILSAIVETIRTILSIVLETQKNKTTGS